MNRNYKFRAWEEHHKIMTYDVIPVGSEAYVLLDNDEATPETGLILVGPSPILMQYTGLKDCDGKEIFEGDILEVYGSAFLKRREVWNEVVEYDKFKGAPYVGFHPFGTFTPQITPSEVKVVGNIYENPELIPASPSKGDERK